MRIHTFPLLLALFTTSEIVQRIDDDLIRSFSAPSELTDRRGDAAGNEDGIMEDPSTPRASTVASNALDSQITVEETQAERQATSTRAMQIQSGIDPDDEELTTECDCGSKVSYS